MHCGRSLKAASEANPDVRTLHFSATPLKSRNQWVSACGAEHWLMLERALIASSELLRYELKRNKGRTSLIW